MALVTSADYETLPLDPTRRWLSLHDLLNKRLNDITDPREGISDFDLIEYCTVLVSAAEELDLGKFEGFSVADVRRVYPTVRAQIIALATKLNMRGSTANAAYSVALPRASKSKLFTQIESLRSLVDKADLSDVQKKKVLAKLDELHTLVLAPRSEFGKVMAIVAYVATTLGGTTAFLADLPDAVTTISSIFGEAKEAEEEEHRFIQVQKAPLQIQDLRKDSGDDEIPF
jgi:hypothetical protein